MKSSLNNFLIEELTDLLNVESQIVDALSQMAGLSQSGALKLALEDHVELSREQLYRLQDIFSTLGRSPQGVIFQAIKIIITRGLAGLTDTQKGPSQDAAIISLAQRMEQCEIHAYQKACEHAADLGQARIVGLLYKTLDEERAMNFYLNEFAQSLINTQTVGDSVQKVGGFYIPERKFKRGNIKKKFKNKNKDVCRFISEGNPNIQEPEEKQDSS